MTSWRLQLGASSLQIQLHLYSFLFITFQSAETSKCPDLNCIYHSGTLQELQLLGGYTVIRVKGKRKSIKSLKYDGLPDLI